MAKRKPLTPLLPAREGCPCGGCHEHPKACEVNAHRCPECAAYQAKLKAEAAA